MTLTTQLEDAWLLPQVYYNCICQTYFSSWNEPDIDEE